MVKTGKIIERMRRSPQNSYQVRQVLDAIARLEAEENEEGDDNA